MKSILIYLILLLIFPTVMFGQKLEINNYDKDTGNKLILTSNKKGTDFSTDDSVVKTGMVFFSAGYSLSNISGKQSEIYFIELDIVHNDKRVGCLQEFDSKVILKMEDESEIECFQISESDCGANAFKGGFALMPHKGSAALMKENFTKLQNLEINELTVYTSAKPMVFRLKPKQKAYLKDHFTLVAKTIKEI